MSQVTYIIQIKPPPRRRTEASFYRLATHRTTLPFDDSTAKKNSVSLTWSLLANCANFLSFSSYSAYLPPPRSAWLIMEGCFCCCAACLVVWNDCSEMEWNGNCRRKSVLSVLYVNNVVTSMYSTLPQRCRSPSCLESTIYESVHTNNRMAACTTNVISSVAF